MCGHGYWVGGLKLGVGVHIIDFILLVTSLLGFKVHGWVNVRVRVGMVQNEKVERNIGMISVQEKE